MPETPLFEYTLSPATVYITKDPNHPSIARLDIGVTNHTGSDIECDWTSFAVIPGGGSGALTADPGAITSSSSCPDEWSITAINGAPGQFRAEPVFPNTGLKAGQSISFRLDNIIVNGALGGTRLEVIERVGEPRREAHPINKIRGDLNIDYFRAQPTDIRPGSMARLSWKTVSAARCTLSWRAGSEEVAVTGSKCVQPSDTTIYTLTAQGGLGPVVSAQTAIVVDRVKIIVFRGPTVRIRPGGKAELVWRTESATRCELRADGVMVDANAPLRADPDSPFLVSPTKDQTAYTLFAYDAQREYVQSQVTVFLQPKFNLSLRETWTEGVPSNMTYIATPSACLDDTRLFAASSGSDGHGSEGEFCVLDSSSRKRIFSRKNPGPREYDYYFLEPSPDGTRLLTQTSRAVGMLNATPNSNHQVLAVWDEGSCSGGAAFHPDGTKVYFPFFYGMDRPWSRVVSAATRDLRYLWGEYKGNSLNGTSISPDGKTLCLVEMAFARLYLMGTWKPEVTMIPIGGVSFDPLRIVSSVWSPDGTKVYATNCTPGTIWVVKVATKEVTRINLRVDVTPALLRLGPAIPEFEEGSNILYALCAPDGTVVGISTDTDQVLSRLSLGQGSNPAFEFVFRPSDLFNWPKMAIAPDGKTIFVSNPPRSSIFMLDNGAQHKQQQLRAFREGVELEETVFDYIVTPNSVYITRDPHNPSIGRLDIGVTNNTGSDKECDWTSFVVIPGEGSGALTEDPGAISPSSSRPDEWSITPIQGAPGEFRAEPVFPNKGLKAGQSISFRLDNIIVNGELGGTRLEVIELVGEPRQKAHPINKIRSDLNIDF